MVKSTLVIFVLLTYLPSYCQFKVSGTWQGLVCKVNSDWRTAEPIYFNFICIGSSISGESREEKYNSTNYSIKTINGKLSNPKSLYSIEFSQVISSNKKTKEASCPLSFFLKYNESTGYFEGNYTNSRCSADSGKIKIYKSDLAFSQDPSPLSPHTWVERFRSDLVLGLSAATNRKKELQEFKFEAIYFDYNSDSIPIKYYPFLDKMTRIILGHSDLRIKIIGNTDSDGSDQYNENLSLRRAASIKKYFENNGLKNDRLINEHHGEKQPAESNKTSEGRRKNRRVEFKFI